MTLFVANSTIALPVVTSFSARMAGMMRRASYDAFSCSTGLRIKLIAIPLSLTSPMWSPIDASNAIPVITEHELFPLS